MKRQNLVVLFFLPFVVIGLLGAQDCGDRNAPGTLTELQRGLTEFLEQVAFLPPNIVPPPGWLEPADGTQTSESAIRARGFAPRGDDRPALNPTGAPAVVEVYRMPPAGPVPALPERLGEAPVGADRTWEIRVPLHRGANILGARVRIGGSFSVFSVIRVNSSNAPEPPPPAPRPPHISDSFTWPTDPTNPVNGIYVACEGDWPGVPSACYRLNSGWRDAQPFQRHHNTDPRINGYHLGADWNLGSYDADENLPVYAVADGEVALVLDPPGQDAWGKVIFIRHDTSFGIYTSMYAHLNWNPDGPPPVGRRVYRGTTQIARVGDADGYYRDSRGRRLHHLHFEIRQGLSTIPGRAYTRERMPVGPEGQIDPNGFIATHR